MFSNKNFCGNTIFGSWGSEQGEMLPNFSPITFAAAMRSLELWAQSRAKCCPFMSKNFCNNAIFRNMGSKQGEKLPNFSQENGCNNAILNFEFQNRAKCCTTFSQENCCNNAIFELSGSGGQNAAFFSYHVCDLHLFGFAKGGNAAQFFQGLL